MNSRDWIIRGLWCQLGSLLLVALSGALSLLLWLAGDATGAAALRALACLSAAVFAASHVGLVLLLAFRELDRDRQRLG